MHLLDNFSTVEQALIAKAAQRKLPINGSIELLPLCNMNCDMCYVRLSREEMEKQGRLRTVQEWLEIVEQMKQAGTLFLLLTGGEPLLYPQFKELYLKLLEMGMILTINTNGTLIDEEWAAFFGQHKPRRINITLYGAGEDTYSKLCHYPGGFEKTINGIRLLQKNNVDVKIGSSLTKTNRKDVKRILEIGDALGAPVRVDTYMLPATRERKQPFCMQSRALPKDAAEIRMGVLKRELGEERYCQYKEQTLEMVKEISDGKKTREGSGCFAGKCSFTINWQGEMRPCVIMSSPSVSVFEQGFEKAWKYITEEMEKMILNAKCSSCSLRPLCRTCAACAWHETGGYKGIPKYMCDYAEESLKLLKDEGAFSF